jgi:acylphosphatase
VITGRVQGVYFRSYTVDMARALGITGWVRNTRGSEVEALFEGEDQAVREMLEWCWTGSPSSRVEGVEAAWEEATGEFDDFSVTYGWRGGR